MSINDIILWLMAVFVLLGGIDRILGNRFGLGEPFEEGITAMGALALAMLGILCLAPVLAGLLRPVVVPLYSLLGADPAMFAGTILANDMGGAPLAMELAQTKEAGQFGGLIVGAMLGPTIVFTIPVGLGIIQAEDRPFLAKGVLAATVGAVVYRIIVAAAIAVNIDAKNMKLVSALIVAAAISYPAIRDKVLFYRKRREANRNV